LRKLFSVLVAKFQISNLKLF